MKAKSNILIISDMCGYGKVSAAVQMPILSYMGHDVFNLPTMLISNTFPYGKYAVMESTSYMKDAMQKWDELGIHFDAITTGFLASEEQAKMVAHYCREQAEQGTEIFVDPVMGDYGRLYSGANEGTVRCMREMLGVAHLCFPNYTEACLLADVPYKEEGMTEAEGLMSLSTSCGHLARSRFSSLLVLSTSNMPWWATITLTMSIFCFLTRKYRYSFLVRAIFFRASL